MLSRIQGTLCTARYLRIKTPADKKILLKQLEAHLSITEACEKSGFSRATFYRLMLSNPLFARQVKLARAMAVDSIDDLAQSKLVEKIEAGNMAAINTWNRMRQKKIGFQELNSLLVLKTEEYRDVVPHKESDSFLDFNWEKDKEIDAIRIQARKEADEFFTEDDGSGDIEGEKT